MKKANKNQPIKTSATWSVLALVFCLSFLFSSCADGEAPVIVETTQLIDTADEFGPYEVITKVFDNRGVDEVLLYYGRQSVGAEGVKTVSEKMKEIGDERYRGEIPGFPVGTTVIYYVEAVDLDGNRSRDPEEDYFTFEVFAGSPSQDEEN